MEKKEKYKEKYKEKHKENHKDYLELQADGNKVNVGTKVDINNVRFI